MFDKWNDELRFGLANTAVLSIAYLLKHEEIHDVTRRNSHHPDKLNPLRKGEGYTKRGIQDIFVRPQVPQLTRDKG